MARCHAGAVGLTQCAAARLRAAPRRSSPTWARLGGKGALRLLKPSVHDDPPCTNASCPGCSRTPPRGPARRCSKTSLTTATAVEILENPGGAIRCRFVRKAAVVARRCAAAPSVIRREGPIEDAAGILSGVRRHAVAFRLVARSHDRRIDRRAAEAHPSCLGRLGDLFE